ncbi:basic helix-loop-helix protein [Microbotryomycetes sp. JL201]|nr:basic helix-loop-helix protein [Microbotryomycetes sp. JL201]
MKSQHEHMIRQVQFGRTIGFRKGFGSCLAIDDSPEQQAQLMQDPNYQHLKAQHALAQQQQLNSSAMPPQQPMSIPVQQQQQQQQQQPQQRLSVENGLPVSINAPDAVNAFATGSTTVMPTATPSRTTTSTTTNTSTILAPASSTAESASILTVDDNIDTSLPEPDAIDVATVQPTTANAGRSRTTSRQPSRAASASAATAVEKDVEVNGEGDADAEVDAEGDADAEYDPEADVDADGDPADGDYESDELASESGLGGSGSGRGAGGASSSSRRKRSGGRNGADTPTASASTPGASSRRGQKATSGATGSASTPAAAGTPTNVGVSAAEPNENEWTRTRKDNHKEVERRRRETINEGINKLKTIVPNCDKNNKGAILSMAVDYIRQLKDNEGNNIQKWSMEKLLSDQAVQSLKDENEKLKVALDGVLRENEALKREVVRLGGKVELNGNKRDASDLATDIPTEKRVRIE